MTRRTRPYDKKDTSLWQEGRVPMARRTRPYDKKDASNLQNPREDFIKSTALRNLQINISVHLLEKSKKAWLQL